MFQNSFLFRILKMETERLQGRQFVDEGIWKLAN